MRTSVVAMAAIVLIGGLACATKRASSTREGKLVAIKATPLGAGSPCLLAGHVIDSSGEPIVGASVLLTQSKRPGFAKASTDINGQFSLPELACKDTCAVHIRADGFSSLSAYIEIPESSQVEITAKLEEGAEDLGWGCGPPPINNRSTTSGAVIITHPDVGVAHPKSL